MTTALHGGFDQVFEISAAYITSQARARLAISDAPISVDTMQQKLSGLIGVQVRGIWLAAATERFAIDGTWVADSPPAASELVLGIELSGGASGLLVERVTVPVNGNPTTLNINPPDRKLDLHAGVVVHLPIVAEPLHVRAAAADPFPAASVRCAALVLSPPVPTQPTAPAAAIEITLDETRLATSPFVTYLVSLATLVGLDPETTVMVPLRTELRRQITDVVTTTLSDAADPQVQEAGRILLYAAEGGVQDAAVLVQAASLRVLLTMGGPGGSTALVSRSLLGAGDDLAVCVNGTSLLHDMVRGIILGIFDGLTAADFVAADPCTVDSRELTTLAGGSDEVILVYLQVGIDESEDLVLWFQIEVEALATDVLVEVEVPITLSAERILTQGSQALAITPTIGAATIASLARTSVPGWGHIVQGVVNGAIGGALANVQAPQPLRQPLPAGSELRVTSFSMHQDDAPTGTRATPDRRLIGMGLYPELGDAEVVIFDPAAPPPPPVPARWRDHDLVITLASSEYPPTMTVTYAVPDSDDPGARIDSLGGTYKRGAREVRWAMSIDAAIAYLRGGGTLWVAPSTPEPTYVEIVESSPPYLRTRRDAGSANNLASLPRCAPVADAPVNDIGGTSTVTLFSPTQVHWRDVIPIGDKGDEMVNQGAKASASCLVVSAVVEMVDRQGAVLASGGPGVAISVGGAGVRLLDNPVGGRSLAVRVHWWFDAYNVCRYRVRYVVSGTGC